MTALTPVDDEAVVYRVAYRPDPFSWTPWQFAQDGRFTGRWDDPDGQFRTVYVGDSMLGCLLEVLSRFRPDLTLAAELDGIEVDEADQVEYPTAPAGHVPRSWLHPRCAGIALLRGTVVDVRTPATVKAVRNHLGPVAVMLGVRDIDAATLKLTAPRALTQRIAAWLYQQPNNLAGARFGSRHGDEFTLWALFERPEDEETPRALTLQGEQSLTDTTHDLLQAFDLFGLSWTDTP